MKGLWVGLVICTSVQGVVMLVVLARFKWEREAAAAAERVHGGDDGLSAEDSAKLSPAGPAGKLDGSSGAGGSRDRGSSRDRGRWRDTTDLEDHP